MESLVFTLDLVPLVDIKGKRCDVVKGLGSNFSVFEINELNKFKEDF